jgi:hypothetical protein
MLEQKPSIVESVQQSLKAGREARAKAAELAAQSAGPQIALKAVGYDELGVVTFIGGAAGSPVKLDLDGEFLSKADLTKMAFDFCSDTGRTFKANHSEPIGCALVETWVGAPIIKAGDGMRTLKADETLTKDMDVVGINIEKGNGSHWFMSVRPEDPEVVEIAKAGGIAGGSWGALVSKTEV